MYYGVSVLSLYSDGSFLNVPRKERSCLDKSDENGSMDVPNPLGL